MEKGSDLPNMTFASGDMSKPEDFLPYEVGYLSPKMLKIAEEELGETEEKKKRCMEELRTLLRNEKNLFVRMDDSWILGFLRGRKYNVQRAFKSMQNYYRVRTEYRHIFDNVCNEVVHNVFRKNFIGFLPHRDKDGRVILVAKLGMWDPEQVSRDLLFWTGCHCTLHSMEDPATQVLGYTIIVDVTGLGNKHIKMCTPENLRFFMHTTQDCFPGRYKALHIVGLLKVFSTMYKLVSPFIPKKLRSRIFLHGNNLQSLHEKVPPCILPSEYGGELGPFSNKQWHDRILSRNEWCLEQRIYGYKQ